MENRGENGQLLVRASTLPTLPSNTYNYQTRKRKKPLNKTKSTPPRLGRQGSFSREIGHAAAETYLITRLAFKLLSYLGLGYRWITRFLGLALYAMLLMPGFLQVAFYYFFSPLVRRSVVYGDQPRNRLDLYLPAKIDSPKPVVAFVTGGAWIIGYKAWGSLLGKQLSEHDIIVACFDYRNFPQGTIGDMEEDVSQGISFVCNNIADYGGDPNRIYLMGQSAGAHISSCALVKQAIKESRGETVCWSTSQIKAYFGLSGGYNLPNLVDHFNNRGLYRSIFLSIMEGEESLQKFSPEIMVQDQSSKAAVHLLPHIILFHGTSDCSIPSDSSKAFVDTLHGVGAQAELILYEGKTHTDLFLQQQVPVTLSTKARIAGKKSPSGPCWDLNLRPWVLTHFIDHSDTPLGATHHILLNHLEKDDFSVSSCKSIDLELQDPLRGGKDDLFGYIVAYIHANDKEALDKDAMVPPRRRLVPEILLKLACRTSPF